MENMVLKAEKGAELIDADGIVMKNVQLITESTNPVLLVDNSSAVTFSNIDYNKSSDLLLSVSGAQTGTIKLDHTDLSKAKKQSEFSRGAVEKSVIISSQK
jgi:hypothetical protein